MGIFFPINITSSVAGAVRAPHPLVSSMTLSISASPPLTVCLVLSCLYLCIISPAVVDVQPEDLELYFFPSPTWVHFLPRLFIFPINQQKEFPSLWYTGRYSRSFIPFPFDFAILSFTAHQVRAFRGLFLSLLCYVYSLYSLRYIFLFCIYLFVLSTY